jgi:hypothetical protein
MCTIDIASVIGRPIKVARLADTKTSGTNSEIVRRAAQLTDIPGCRLAFDTPKQHTVSAMIESVRGIWGSCRRCLGKGTFLSSEEASVSNLVIVFLCLVALIGFVCEAEKV